MQPHFMRNMEEADTAEVDTVAVVMRAEVT